MLVCSPAKNSRPQGCASQPRSEGSKVGIENRVSAPCPGIGFPAELAPPGHGRLGRPEPFERADDARNAFFRDDVGGGIAGRSSGQE